VSLRKDPDEYLASLKEHDLPEDCEWLWWVFQSLSASRPSGGQGPSGIPLTEIEAWGRLYCHEFIDVELDYIQALDAVWLDEVRKHGSSSSPRPKNRKQGRGNSR
jgi:hypothetical protein